LYCIIILVITVIFHYYTVSMHDTDSHMIKSVMKCWGNVREFLDAGEWSPCNQCYFSLKILLYSVLILFLSNHFHFYLVLVYLKTESIHFNFYSVVILEN